MVILAPTWAGTAFEKRPISAWPVASPESQGMNSGALADMVDYVRERALAVHSVLIVRHGRVVMDATFHPYGGERPHDVASVTKSVMSMLIGIAIDKGYIKGVKQPVLELLSVVPEAPLDPRKQRLTVEHLLTMTSGLDCGVTPGEKELSAMRQSSDWVRFALALPTRADPGAEYAYCSCNNHLLSGILSARTGDSALAFARKHLFEPLGIGHVIWPADPHGRTHGWGDLHLSPSDLAKIAHVYLNGGRWNGAQIVSEQWVRQSTVPHVSVRDGVGYGYAWWINTTRQPHIFEAIGRGGQRAAVLRDERLVVVFNGGGVNTDELAPFLFKAIQSDAALPSNQTGARRLRKALDDARKPRPRSVTEPLPALAGSISGTRYVIDRNPLALESLSLTFSGPNEAQARVRMDGEDWSLPVGLDGRYRFSASGPEGIPIAARGRWVSRDEFLLDLNTVANINHFAFRLRFVGQEVQLQVDEATGEIKNLQIRGRAH